MVKMSTPSDQSQRVTRVIYKQLLCLARHFDSRPALKALTINPLHSQQIKFTKISPSIERYYGKSLTFYFEPKSLTSSIRNEFRLTKEVGDNEEIKFYHGDLFSLLKILKSSDFYHNDKDQLNFNSNSLSIDPAMPQTINNENKELITDDWRIKPLFKFPLSSASNSSLNVSNNSHDESPNNRRRPGKNSFALYHRN